MIKKGFNLGDKVKCNGFLKKTGNYIEIEKDDFGYQKYASTEDGELVDIKTFERKELIGFICGKRSVATQIYCDTNEHGTIHIFKCNFVDCYEICVENKNKSWGKRLVPINFVRRVQKKYATVFNEEGFRIMFEKLIELIDKTRELRAEAYEIFNKIKSDYHYIYVRKKGIRVPYTYRKYSTEYLEFDYNICALCLKFGKDKGISFSPGRYRKTWSFSKEDFE